jgi:antitoxin component of RelBE/YafQ-DinJ toxin-antitoxin module
MKDEDSIKRVYVYMKEKQHVDLKIRLDFHGMSMSEFVRVCAEGVLDENPIMEQFIDFYKEHSKKHSKKSLAKEKKDREEADEILESLGLSVDDIEDIFDIIENDHPEI